MLAAAFLAPMLALAAASGGAAGNGCHWVEGRLTVGNGTPSVRIWPRGTRRLLGVTSRLEGPEGSDVMPGNVRRFLASNGVDRVWGRFRICPLAADRRGWMRPVIVTHARDLVPARP